MLVEGGAGLVHRDPRAEVRAPSPRPPVATDRRAPRRPRHAATVEPEAAHAGVEVVGLGHITPDDGDVADGGHAQGLAGHPVLVVVGEADGEVATLARRAPPRRCHEAAPARSHRRPRPGHRWHEHRVDEVLGQVVDHQYQPLSSAHSAPFRPPGDGDDTGARRRPGGRVRLRIINAGGDTAYRVALGGHKLTITHTDGYPVEHQQVDALLIGMGERYDVLVTLDDGVFPLVALAEGKNASGLALMRTGSGSAPKPTVRQQELDGLIMTASQLRAADDVRLEAMKADRVHRVELTGGMDEVQLGHQRQAVRHERPDRQPALGRGRPAGPPRLRQHHRHVAPDAPARPYLPTRRHRPAQDTTIVLPKKTVSVVFDADNPGQWMLHCHNAYHGEAGMMAILAYQK